MLSENMASLGADDLTQSATTRKSATAAEETPIDTNIHDDSTTNRKPIDREDRLRMIKDRQNEERQRKLEELKAQAAAAQKYREQKEDERRRRIDDMRVRELDRKQQVEERKRAIQDAEKDRREYILRKNQERDSRIETKRRNERSSIAFAFGSSTPRLLDPVDVGTMSNSSLWAHRRSTSISNVAYSGAPLSRRSSERELSDGGKKRATSAGGLDRNDGGQRQMSTSMYEVFNWGPLNDARPKRYSLAIAGSQIDIGDGPHTSGGSGDGARATSSSAATRSQHQQQQQQQHHQHQQQHHHQHNSSSHNRTDDVDAAHLSYRSVHRRKTDLMPTIPSPRDGFGSRSSLYCHTPRTPGSRSGDVTPGTSRPGSALSTSTSVSGVLYRRSNGSASATPRKPRPASIAGTGMSIDSLNEASKLRNSKEKPPLPRVSSAMRKSMTSSTNGLNTSVSGSLTTAKEAPPKETPKRTPAPERRVSSVRKTPRPVSAVISASAAPAAAPKSAFKQPALAVQSPSASVTSDVATIDTVTVDESATPINAAETAPTTIKSEIELAASSAVDEIMATAANVAAIKKSNSVEEPHETDEPSAQSLESVEQSDEFAIEAHTTEADAVASNGIAAVVVAAAAATEPQPAEPVVNTTNRQRSPAPATPVAAAAHHPQQHHHQQYTLEAPSDGADSMTASMIKRISTAEEAKAALAERRRLAREEAERQAELERQRMEEADRAEMQRQVDEEERQRQFEVETLRLVEEQRKAEELRLSQAIEEAAQREHEERARREDEERQKVERERDEQKAREEAERQKIEVAERLKKEEKEREERRKRVEAIMSRTRAKGAASAAATPTSTPSKTDDKPDTSDKTSTDSSSSSSSNNSISASETTTSAPIVEPLPAVVQATVAATNTAAVPDVTGGSIADYEQSVTDKENTLINSFSNLIISNGQPQTLSGEPHINGLTAAKQNGKLNYDLLNEEDDVLRRTNGNNGHHHHHHHNAEPSLDNKIDSTGCGGPTVDNKLLPNVGGADSLVAAGDAGQLIDFSLESTNGGGDALLLLPTATTVSINNNNNNNNINHSMLVGGGVGSDSLNLVNTTDSHEHKEISLL